MGGEECAHVANRDLGLHLGSGSRYSVTLGKFFTLSVPVSHLQNKHCNNTTFGVIINNKQIAKNSGWHIVNILQLPVAGYCVENELSGSINTGPVACIRHPVSGNSFDQQETVPMLRMMKPRGNPPLSGLKEHWSLSLVDTNQHFMLTQPSTMSLHVPCPSYYPDEIESHRDWVAICSKGYFCTKTWVPMASLPLAHCGCPWA